MTCSGQRDCTCGCCAGVAVQTPQGEDNRRGLPAIAYRTGVWATFKNSMLARLSSADYPALAGLKTRNDDDFSIALLDASAMMLDVLTFYQERLANESYLRTATQLSSLTELARLIGYQPSPGVAASTYLAFTIRAATGAPDDPTATAITIPAGTKVQSVPAQGQTPQTFETSNDILAKADWNALPVQTGVPWRPERRQTSVYLAGTSTQLNPGDAILIVGDERAKPPYTSEQWDVRIVSSVEPDGANGRTRVVWSEGLGHGGVGPTQDNPKFYALRQRASLFGYNAVNPLLLAPRTVTALTAAMQIAGDPPDWRFNVDTIVDSNFTDPPLPSLSAEGVLDLDGVYAKANPGGWIVLISPDQNQKRSPSGFVKLYGVTSVTTISRSAFGVSAKVSRLGLDTNQDLIAFITLTRTSSALLQSEALTVAEEPLDHPLYGAQVDLKIVRNDLAGVTAVAISGKRQKLAVKPGVSGLLFTPDDGSPQAPLAPGDVVALTQPPDVLRPDGSVPDWRGESGTLTLAVADSNGRTGTVEASLNNFTLTGSSASDPTVQEFALVSSIAIVNAPFPHTRLALSAPLINCYDRPSTSVNANVGAATAGASVAELIGSGSASTPDQTFTLKQAPLTYVSAPTPTGRQSTLQVRANGVSWTEEPTLYGQPPNAQVFRTLNRPGGVTQIEFGDGVEGATLPTGQSNIMASYRVGLGAAGNVGAAMVTTLVDRPLGVSGVVNPLAASGGQDAQSVEDIRASAPLTVENSRPRRLDRRLSDHRRDLRRRRQSLGALDPVRPLSRGLHHRRGGRRRGAAARQPDAQESGRDFAELWQSERRHLPAILPGDDLQRRRRSQGRSRLRRRLRARGGEASTLCNLQFCFPSVRAGCDGRRNRSPHPERAGRHRGQCEACQAGRDQRSRRHRQRGLLAQRLQRLDGRSADDAASALPGRSVDDLPLCAGRERGRSAPSGGNPRPRSGSETPDAGDHGMSLDLFQLFPAVYRIRDAQLAAAKPLLTLAEAAEQAALTALTPPLSADDQARLDELNAKASRGPLQSVLMVIGEQIEAVSYDLDRLYDDQFIETCAPWVIPYIGDLIGYQSIEGVAAAVDDPRAEVADTIAMRRRKGTILTLEELARDATGWSAHAVEFFQTLGDTQYLNHIRARNWYAPDLRDWRAGANVDAAFDRTSHRVDVRRIASRRGRYNIQNIGVFLWTLGAYGISNAPGASAPANAGSSALCYRFHPLGIDAPLFHRAVSQGDPIEAAARPVNVPDRLKRRPLCEDLKKGVGAEYYGETASSRLHPRRAAGRSLSNPGGQPFRRGRRLGECASAGPLPPRRRPGARTVRLSTSRFAGRIDGILVLRFQRRDGRRRLRSQQRLRSLRSSMDRSIPRSAVRDPQRCDRLRRGVAVGGRDGRRRSFGRQHDLFAWAARREPPGWRDPRAEGDGRLAADASP